MAVAGIDVGAISTKAVILADGRQLARDIQPTGLDAAGAAASAVDNCCKAGGIDRANLGQIVVTGNGRKAG